jgi:hypothetical protein
MDILTSEFRSSGSDRTGGGVIPIIGGQNGKIAEWKFDLMDANEDGFLRKSEFKSFRLSVKDAGPARNRHCARNFWQYCDLDADRRMSMTEWNTCLGIGSSSKNRMIHN